MVFFTLKLFYPFLQLMQFRLENTTAPTLLTAEVNKFKITAVFFVSMMDAMRVRRTPNVSILPLPSNGSCNIMTFPDVDWKEERI